ncbi:hypothetical protein K7X08_010715 [Anisodus acutangulus]|uniref:Retrotransposon gag domain-containing protein n=1 Tax=Anisodus acutangulus TaxID=402998 RepID=A0A9Q1RA21_9SOLA|nr:hypothetical protein K7X08_010715 [Anisodus acutangulus]
MYSQSSASRYYQIQREIVGVIQGDLDIASYFKRLRRLWDELKTAAFRPTYICGAEPLCNEGQKLVQFFTSLNDTYSNMRSNILMMSHVPTLGKAYSMLLYDENQREIQISAAPFFSDSTSFYAKSNPGYSNFRSNYEKHTPWASSFGSSSRKASSSGTSYISSHGLSTS